MANELTINFFNMSSPKFYFLGNLILPINYDYKWRKNYKGFDIINISYFFINIIPLVTLKIQKSLMMIFNSFHTFFY